MKKVFSILTVVLYLGITSLSIISLHYCHDNLISFSINGDADACCSETSGILPGCCKDVVYVVDFDIDQLSTAQLVINHVNEIIAVSINSVYIFNEDLAEEQFSGLYIDYPPPNRQNSKLYIHHQSCLFYS